MLIIPGADTWAEGHDEVLALASDLVTAGKPVAAICGATLGLARAGLLDDRPHTSNAPDYLAMAPSYHGAEHYREAKVVAGDTIITAPATAPIDFARAIFERLEAFPAPVLEAWYGLYTTGERRYFDALVGGGQ
jgi:putative intracellular protease/amidase